MVEKRNDRLIMFVIVGSFILSFLINILASVLFPPDFSGDFPSYSPDWAITLQVAGAFLVIGLTVLAMKAEEEKQILAAAGFTAIAISFGISILSTLNIAEIETFKQYESQYRMTISSIFFLIPASILIATYNRFRKWIRYFTVFSVVPYFVASLLFLYGIRDYHKLERVIIVGVILVSLSWTLWAYNIYDNYRRNQKEVK